MSFKPQFRSNGLRGRQFSLEQLDARICLSADPILEQGVLSITGSREADTILVRDDGRGSVTVEDGDSDQRWEFRGVERIIVDSLGGDDTIRFTRRGGDSPIPARWTCLPVKETTTWWSACCCRRFKRYVRRRRGCMSTWPMAMIDCK